MNSYLVIAFDTLSANPWTRYGLLKGQGEAKIPVIMCPFSGRVTSDNLKPLFWNMYMFYNLKKVADCEY